MYCTNQAREIIFNEYLMAVMQGHGCSFFLRCRCWDIMQPTDYVRSITTHPSDMK